MKKCISIILSFALAFTCVFSMNVANVDAASKVGKVKITYYNLDIKDGVVLKWQKVKKADGYMIYRGKLGTTKATGRVRTIVGNKKTNYVSGIYDKKNNKNKYGFVYRKYDPYQVKAFKYVKKHGKYVKKNGKRVRKVIAKSDVMYMYSTFGENGSVTGYLNIAKTAVDTTTKVLNTLGASKWGSVGKGLTSFLSNLGKGISAVNTVLGFLGFGSSKDSGPTIEEEMYAEIQDMHVELNHIDSMVEKMSDELSQFRAESKYNETLSKASDLNAQWNNFEQKYMENGMEEQLQTYEFKIREGLKAWWKGNRTDSETGIDINNVTVKYEPESGDLVLERQNGVKASESDYSYITLKEKSLPKAGSYFDMDEYQEALTDAIENGIRQGVLLDDPSEYFESANMPIFTKDGWAAASYQERNEAIEKACKDAHDVLLYKIGYIVVNQNPEMVRDTISTFKNYCTNLGKSEYGVDALIGALKSSNAFAGEIREQFNNFCATMLMKTGEYAAFTIDLIGKSNITKKSATDPGSDINIAAGNWLNAVNTIDEQSSAMSPYDDYCFVTNCRLDVLPVTAELFFSGTDPSKSDFVSCDVAPLSQKTKGREVYLVWGTDNDYYKEDIASNMIKPEQAQLINMLFLGKAHEGTFTDYLRNVCEVKYDVVFDTSTYTWDPNTYELHYIPGQEPVQFTNCITSTQLTVQNFADKDYALPTHAIIYAFHPKVSTFADQKNNDKMFYAKKMLGSYIDTATAEIKNNAILLAGAASEYQESWNSCYSYYPYDAYRQDAGKLAYGTTGSFVFVKVK